MVIRLLFLSFLIYFNSATAQQRDSVDILIFEINADETLGRLKSDTTISYYDYGKSDAKEYYKGYKKAATLTVLSSSCLMLAAPIAGLASAIACSSTTPKTENLDLPYPDLAQNESYLAGYKWQAKKIKQKKVWKNWIIGFGINTAILSLILLAPTK